MAWLTLIEGVARDVLRPVSVQVLEGELIVILSAVGDASKFGVLNPEVGFDQFGGGKKTQNGDITAIELLTVVVKTQG